MYDGPGECLEVALLHDNPQVCEPLQPRWHIQSLQAIRFLSMMTADATLQNSSDTSEGHCQSATFFQGGVVFKKCLQSGV